MGTKQFLICLNKSMIQGIVEHFHAYFSVASGYFGWQQTPTMLTSEKIIEVGDHKLGLPWVVNRMRTQPVWACHSTCFLSPGVYNLLQVT